MLGGWNLSDQRMDNGPDRTGQRLITTSGSGNELALRSPCQTVADWEDGRGLRYDRCRSAAMKVMTIAEAQAGFDKVLESLVNDSVVLK